MWCGNAWVKPYQQHSRNTTKVQCEGYSNVKAIALGSVVNVVVLTLITGSAPLVLCIDVL